MRRDEHAMIAKSPRVTRTTADAVNINEEYSTDQYSTDRNHTESRPHSDGYISNYLC